jgi:hypothetical protein
MQTKLSSVVQVVHGSSDPASVLITPTPNLYGSVCPVASRGVSGIQKQTGRLLSADRDSSNETTMSKGSPFDGQYDLMYCAKFIVVVTIVLLIRRRLLHSLPSYNDGSEKDKREYSNT